MAFLGLGSRWKHAAEQKGSSIVHKTRLCHEEWYGNENGSLGKPSVVKLSVFVVTFRCARMPINLCHYTAVRL